jgi:large repetitive protein
VTVAGHPAPTVTVAESLPAGLTLSEQGLLSGTPEAGTGGIYPLTITAANGVNPIATQTFTLTINNSPAFTSANATTMAVGTEGSFNVTASSVPAATFSLSGDLPAGLSFSDAGLLSGMPADGSGGTYVLTVTASNGSGSDAVQSFTLTINEAPGITSANAATFEVGVANSFQVTVDGYPASTFSVAESLPAGLSLSEQGLLSGTPEAGTGGIYPLTITAANGVNPNATQTFTLTINNSPAFTSANATTMAVGTEGSFNVTASSVPAATFSLSGDLPAGLSFSAAGLLSGTPEAGTGGTYALTITASNGSGQDAVQPFTLTVNEAPQITSANATVFEIGVEVPSR